MKVIKLSPTNVNEHKILVTYDSQFGSTKEIARFIGDNLSANKQEVDIKRINEVDNLSSYSKVIVGSAIQYDKWMPEARKFIIKNETELSTKSVSFFLVCLALSKGSVKANLQANSYAKEIKNLVPQIIVRSFGKFAGVLDFSKMPFGLRMLAKVMFVFIGVKEGDYRDWKSIKKWSETLEI